MASKELSILITARNLAGRVLGQVRGDIERRTSRMPSRGQTIPEDFAKGVEVAVHQAFAGS